MTEEILKRKPQTVVLIATVAQARSNDERVDPSLDETVRRLTEAESRSLARAITRASSTTSTNALRRPAPTRAPAHDPQATRYAAENPAKEIFDKYPNLGCPSWWT